VVGAAINGSTDLKEDWLFDIGGGYSFPAGLRAELEYSQRFNKLEPNRGLLSGKTHAYSYMANAYWDFNKAGRLRPHSRAGIGVPQLTARAYSLPANSPLETASGSDTGFSYQFMGGLGYAVTDNLIADVGLRFLALDDADIRTASSVPGLSPGATTKFDYDQ